MMNYKTKFAIGDRVKIVGGLYRGRVGKVQNYMPQTRSGFELDNFNRKIEETFGHYEIKLGFWNWVYVFESDLEFEVVK